MRRAEPAVDVSHAAEPMASASRAPEPTARASVATGATQTPRRARNDGNVSVARTATGLSPEPATDAPVAAHAAIAVSATPTP